MYYTVEFLSDNIYTASEKRVPASSACSAWFCSMLVSHYVYTVEPLTTDTPNSA